MNPAGITDVFFDLDHTLWDFDKNSSLAFGRVFANHKIEMEIDAFVKVYEPINFEYWKLFREEKVTQQELRHGRLLRSFESLKMTVSPETIDAISTSYITELPVDNHLFDGAIEILDYLSAKYTLHIITNGFQEVQYLKLNNSGIRNYFSTVTTSEETGVKKPNPLIFEHALQKAGIEAARAVMIGDTFEADILGAKAVGMQALFYNYRAEETPESCSFITTLAEIRDVL